MITYELRYGKLKKKSTTDNAAIRAYANVLSLQLKKANKTTMRLKIEKAKLIKYIKQELVKRVIKVDKSGSTSKNKQLAIVKHQIEKLEENNKQLTEYIDKKTISKMQVANLILHQVTEKKKLAHTVKEWKI